MTGIFDNDIFHGVPDMLFHTEDTTTGTGLSLTMLRTRPRTEQVAQPVRFTKFWLLAAQVIPKYDPFTKTFPVHVTQLVESDYE